MKLQLKRSKSVTGPADAKQPVAPTVEQTLYGELCVNYNAGDPALYVKTENPDSIVRIDGNTKTYNISTQSITDGAQIDLNHKNTGLNNATVESSVLLKKGTGITITRGDDGNITISADGSALTAVNLSYSRTSTGGTVNNSAGDNAPIPLVDGTYAGLMAPGDKTKLNGIDTGADVNPTAGRALTYDGSTLDADIATASDFGVVKIGSGLSIDDNGILTASGIAAVNLDYEAAENQGKVTNSAGDDAVIPLADGTNAGLFTAAEKTKLSGIETGAQKNAAVNLDYEAAENQGKVTNSAGDDAVIPLAKGDKAGLTIENFTTALKTKLEGLTDIDVGSDPPEGPSDGDLWIDTGECPPELKIWDDCSDIGNPSWTPIGGGTPPIPAITFDVSITDSGTDGNVVGETLTAVAANIAGGVDPIVKGYKWFVDNVEDTAATTNTRVIVASDIGLEITCEITCGEPGDPAADVTKTATYGKTPAASAINFTAAITDSGTDGNKVGQTLTAVAQSISGGLSPVEKAYQWYSNGIPEAGPEGAQKEKDILVSDVGETITCEITVAEPDGSNAVTKTATYGRTPELEAVINKPTVLTPPDGAGIGGDITYTPKTSAIANVNGSTLTLTDSNTYNNADGSAMPAPISTTFVAGDTVKGKVVSPGPDTPAFSTTFYEGVGFGSDAAETVIPTGINNTNKALVWTKNRDKGATPGGNHYLWTTSFDGNLKSNDRDGLGTSPSYAQASYTSNSAILPSDLSGNGWSLAGDNYVAWNFRAAPGFFDIVTYDGTSETTEIPHSLGSTPGVVIVKKTTAASQWSVYHSSLGPTKYIELNAPSPEKTTSYYWNDTSPTSSVFTVDTNSDVNELNHKYVAYLFADTPGKIKCGGYDGIGTDQIIETGFACAWVMIKSTKNSDNWKVFWREAPAEEMLFPNTNDPETPTYSGLRMDEPAVPDQNGFSVDGQDIANKNGETYIYVAIAKDVVAGEIPPTGTLTADADDAGPTISLTNVTGTWEDGMEVVNDKELTEFAPSAADLQFTSSVPSGTDITTYAFATWEVDTDSLFGSPMTTPKAITAGAIQELLPSERGAITLAGDTEYHVRVKYTSSDPAGVQSQYSDANHFKTAYIPQDGWNLVTIPTDRRWQEIAYGDGKYVAVGEDGGQRLMISTDAVSWSERTVPQDMWRVLTYGDGKFVAVALQGGANGVMWSTEPFGGWSLASLPTSIDNISGIVYGGDKFVVVGQTGSTKVVWANDPAGPWTGAILPENNFWMDVTYGSGYYVAIASSGTSRIAWATNPNGPWTANSNVPDAEYRAITYGDGKFVAVAARGSAGVIYAEDPTGTWTTATNGAAFGDAIAYGDNKFLTVSENGPNNISYAEDPAGPWTAVAAPVDQGWHRVMYGGGKFVSLAYEGTDQLMWSETGKAASALFTAYDADNKKSVNDLNIVERYGVDPTADNTHLGIYELTEQPTGAVAAYVPEGDKYKPIIDLSRPLERAQAEAAQANARLDEANATIETIRADFEARISTLESGS